MIVYCLMVDDGGVVRFRRLIKWLGVIGVVSFSGSLLVTIMTRLFWVFNVLGMVGIILMIMAALLALIYYIALMVSSLLCKCKCQN